MRILLDKGFVRRVLEGFLRVTTHQSLTSEQKAVLERFRQYQGRELLYLSYKSHHLLTHRFGHLEIVQRIFSVTGVLYPTRYARRWARRLRTMGFLREDALMISMGSFSSDKIYKGRLVGADNILTLDYRMYQRFQNQHDLISAAFSKMVKTLEAPFHHAKLPIIEIVRASDLPDEIT